MAAKTSIYANDEVRAIYGPTIDYFKDQLKGYNSVGFIGDNDIDEIRTMLIAKGPEPANSMLEKLVERMFPGQSKELLQSEANREALKAMMDAMVTSSRNDSPAAGGGKLVINGKPVSVGFVYLQTDLKHTMQSIIGRDLPGNPTEDRDPARMQRELRDAAVLTAAHEIGHLVDQQQRGDYSYDVTRTPPRRTFSQLEQNQAENFADRFAAIHIPRLAAAGALSNPRIHLEFEHVRNISEITRIFKTDHGKEPEIDHATGLLGGGERLQQAARQLKDIWDETTGRKYPTPETAYAFMQNLKKLNDIPEDVRQLATAYVNSYNHMMQGRDPAAGRKMAANLSADDIVAMKQNEPVIAHSEVEARMLVKGQLITEFFANKAEGQVIQLAPEIPDLKISKRIENGMMPA